jgi:hypothetical protein
VRACHSGESFRWPQLVLARLGGCASAIRQETDDVDVAFVSHES